MLNPSLKISIVVLNWNGMKDTLACLESLKKLSYSLHEIIVVDNGSTDGSVPAIREAFPHCKLIETGAASRARLTRCAPRRSLQRNRVDLG